MFLFTLEWDHIVCIIMQIAFLIYQDVFRICGSTYLILFEHLPRFWSMKNTVIEMRHWVVLHWNRTSNYPWNDLQTHVWAWEVMADPWCWCLKSKQILASLPPKWLGPFLLPSVWVRALQSVFSHSLARTREEPSWTPLKSAVCPSWSW